MKKNILILVLFGLSSISHAELVAPGVERVFHEIKQTDEKISFIAQGSASKETNEVKTEIKPHYGRTHTPITIRSTHYFKITNSTDVTKSYWVNFVLCVEIYGCLNDLSLYNLTPKATYDLQLILFLTRVFSNTGKFTTEAITVVSDEVSVQDHATSTISISN